jgi:glycosyltransferase involved in cell wall biosynthesis
MRVLVLNSEYPPIGGGAGNASAHIAQSLAQQGVDVTVLTAAFATMPRDEMQHGVRIIRLPGIRRRADRSNALEQLSFMIVASLWGLAWKAKIKPHSVLAFFGAPSGVAAWFWSLFSSTPYIVCLRGGDVPGFRPYDFGRVHKWLGPLLRLVWKRAHAVVANSQGLKDLGLAFESKVPIQVIHNGVDLDRFQNKGRSWQPAHMLFVGRLVYQKGLDLLLSALGDLKDLPWQLSVVGDGPRLGWLKTRAEELGLRDRIVFEGWQAREDLPQLFQRANLFVYPTRHEGMPNALLESMASALPAVATRIAGNEELVVDGETGLLIPPDDSDALKTALHTLISAADLREKMGEAARQRASDNYAWQGVAERYLELIEESLTNAN